MAGQMLTPSQRMIVAAAVAVLALAAPWFAYPVFLMTALCFALFACAFNLLLGYAGLMSFGHAMFFGMAGYFYGHVVKAWDMPPELGLLAGVAGAALLGLVTGALAIRRQGIYFAMITLAFAQMVYFFCIQAPFTHGEDGLQGIVRKPLLGGLIPTKDDRVLYYVVLAIFLFGYGAIYRFIHSPFGQVLKAIRDNEQRALSLGYEADRYKLLAFVLSAALAGLAGATKALVLQFATLTDVSAAMSGEVVLMALVGGLGTIIGPVIGAFVIITMQNYLAASGEFVLVIQGVIFVVIVMAFRKGVVGEFSEWWKARRSGPRARRRRRTDARAIGGAGHQAILERRHRRQAVDQHEAGDHEHRQHDERDQAVAAAGAVALGFVLLEIFVLLVTAGHGVP